MDKMLMFALALNLCSGLSLSEYSKSVELDPGYTAYYRVEASRFYLALQIDSAQQWFAFGIPEPAGGDMDGSDILVIENNAGNGQVTVSDRYALDKSTPLVDECQDWKLESSSVDGNVLTVELSRDVDTETHQDRVIPVTGTMTVVWAYGSSLSGSIQYHSSNRGFSSLNFDEDSAIPSSWMFQDFQISNFTSSTTRTIYACQTFSFRNDSEFHAVRFEVVEDPRRQSSSMELHHLIIYACNAGSGYYVNRYSTPQQCNTVTGKSNSGCSFPMFTWAKGDKFYNLPSNVGFRIGAGAFDKFVVEMHYDNPEKIAGEIDSSTVRVYYTNEFRENDAGVLVVGDPYTFIEGIPAGSEAVEVNGICGGACTSQFRRPLTVFGSLLHMHSHGSQIWSTLYKSSGETQTYNQIGFYNYGFQRLNSVDFVLSPGDVIDTHCVYDTREETAPVGFGASSANEMCMDFLYYYPYNKTDNVASHCGYANTGTYVICDLDYIPLEDNLPTLDERPTFSFGLAGSQCTSGAPHFAVMDSLCALSIVSIVLTFILF